MRALILAAGRGSRMKGLTESRPKCLTQLRGRALLDWQLAALASGGISQIALVSGYRAELLKRPGLTAFENPRWHQSNMVVSLSYASDWLASDPCLICYGDILYSPAAVSAIVAAPGELLVPYNQRWLEIWQARFEDPLSDAESFQINAQGQLTDIGRRVSSYDEIQGQYMGLLKLSPASWQTIREYLASLPQQDLDKLDMTRLLRSLIEEGLPIQTLAINGGWLEIDSQQDLAAAEQLLEQDPGFDWLRQL